MSDTPEAREALALVLRDRLGDMSRNAALNHETWLAHADAILAALTPAGPEERGEGLREALEAAVAALDTWMAWLDKTWDGAVPTSLTRGVLTDARKALAATPAPDTGADLSDLFATQLQETGRVIGHRGDEQAIARALDVIGIERFEVRVAPDTGAEERLDEAYEAGRLVGYEEGRTAQARVQDASGAEERLRAALDSIDAEVERLRADPDRPPYYANGLESAVVRLRAAIEGTP